jgi:hypothetical protein
VLDDTPAERTEKHIIEDVLSNIITYIENSPTRDFGSILMRSTPESNSDRCGTQTPSQYHKAKTNATLQKQKEVLDKNGGKKKLFNPSWKGEYPWLLIKTVDRTLVVDGEEVIVKGWGMFCTCCTEEKHTNPFTQEGGQNTTRALERVTEHVKTRDHKAAMTASSDARSFQLMMQSAIILEVCKV